MPVGVFFGLVFWGLGVFLVLLGFFVGCFWGFFGGFFFFLHLA